MKISIAIDFTPAYDTGTTRRDLPLYLEIANGQSTEMLSATEDFKRAALLMADVSLEREIYTVLAPYLVGVQPRAGGGWDVPNLVSAAAVMLTLDVGHARAIPCPCCGLLFRQLDDRAVYCSQACQTLAFQRTHRDAKRRSRRAAREAGK